jgi:glycosyltransferase involved in cell wall biosynthesis
MFYRDLCISVCLAAYNGEKYIEEQIFSIIKQLEVGDELIVVDDCSVDNTNSILNSICDSRLHIFRNDVNIGINKSFEKAIQLSSNKYIYLADQDDIWLDYRALDMKLALYKSDKYLVSSNAEYIDAVGMGIIFKSRSLKISDSSKYIKNLFSILSGTAPYYGCAMAFDRSMMSVIMPFPEYIESHDLWIAIAGNLMHSNIHIENITLRRRIHGENASVLRRRIYKKIYSRFIFIVSMIHLFLRIIRIKYFLKIN